jgi:hypothetical protein
MEHGLLVFFMLGFFLMRLWYKMIGEWLAPRFDLKGKCHIEDDESLPVISPRTGTSRPLDSLADCLIEHLPIELRGQIASYCGLQPLAQLCISCTSMQIHIWDSKEVWHALWNAAGFITLRKDYDAWQAREAFRHAVFRTDLASLHRLATQGNLLQVLEEAGHVACGLMIGDLSDSSTADFVQIALRSLSSHDPANPTMAAAAQRFLRAIRRSMELYTEEQVESLEYAYKSIHQLHDLMVSSMQESYKDMLDDSFWPKEGFQSDSTDDDRPGSPDSLSQEESPQ